MNWKTWLKGLLSAAIGGAANVVTAIVVDPIAFNFQEGLGKLGAMAGMGAIIAVALYLKQSPLPEYELRVIK